MDIQSILSTVESWPPEKRVELIERLWDGLGESRTLTETQMHDLQGRLEAYRDNPRAGSPWDEVKARLQGSGR